MPGVVLSDSDKGCGGGGGGGGDVGEANRKDKTKQMGLKTSGG